MQKWLRRPVYSLRVVPGERGAYEEAAASKRRRTGVVASRAYYRLPDDGGFGSATIRQTVAAGDRSKLPEVGNIPDRSEERSVGKDGGGTCKSRRTPYH